MPLTTNTLLAEIMTHAVHSIAPETTLKDAARLMADEKISSLLVEQDGISVGIITETNIIRALHQHRVPETTARDIMSQPLITARDNLDLLSARHLIDSHGIRHLVVVDNAGKTVGIVSDTDFRLFLGINVFRNLRTLETVMDRQMPCLPPEALLAKGISSMLEQDMDYVVVASHGKPLAHAQRNRHHPDAHPAPVEHYSAPAIGPTRILATHHPPSDTLPPLMQKKSLPRGCAHHSKTTPIGRGIRRAHRNNAQARDSAPSG
jgi:CBS domain-containing protein